MQNAFNIESIKKHQLIDDAITLHKSKIITDAQFDTINKTYNSGLYCPNFMIKIVLFLGTTLAISGITSFIALLFLDALDTMQEAYKFISIFYGLGLFFFANIILIKDKRHFRSGSIESVLYHASAFFLFGVFSLTDFNIHVLIISLIFIALFLSIYYMDILFTIFLPLVTAYYIFYLLQIAGGIVEQLTPFILFIIFGALYFPISKLSEKKDFSIYDTQFTIIKTITLLLAYLSINYLVVREMSVNLMNLQIEQGQDIPLAFLFYFLTIAIPIYYLWYGIKTKNSLFLRLGLIITALTVLTFKYYYSSGHTEITLTLAGAILLSLSYYVMKLLKTPKNGFTRERILTDKWADKNLEATIISQTMGGNQIDDTFKGEGGNFGGGGASGSF